MIRGNDDDDIWLALCVFPQHWCDVTCMTITAEKLKQLIISELEDLNFIFDEEGNLLSPNFEDKEAIRRLHKPAQQAWIKQALSRYQRFFADGCEIIPEIVEPRLVQVKDTWHSDLFRLTRYLWSPPQLFYSLTDP